MSYVVNPAGARRTAGGGGGGRRSLLTLAVLSLLAVSVVLAHYAVSARQYALSAKELSQQLERELQEAKAAHTAAAASAIRCPEPVKDETAAAQQQQQQQQQQQAAGATAAAGVTPDNVVLGKTQCLETCCWRYEEVEWHYAGEKGRRPKLDDRLTPGDAKTLADVVLHGIYPTPEWMGKPPFTELREDLLPCLQPGTVIFIEGDTKRRFFEQLHPRIKHPYILISGDGDDPSPGEYRKFIDDPKILGWWGFNCDFPGIHRLPKFHCYPLGLTQWWGARDSMQRAFDERIAPLHWELDLDAAAEAAAAPKLFLANYQLESNMAKRTAAHRHFCEGPLAAHSSCAGNNDRDVLAYFRRLRQHMFNVAPEGYGLDSYRPWETLYLGRYPIVINSTIDESFAGLPVWIVESWDEVTPESARAVFRLFSRKQWEWGKLYKGWWQRRIYDLRPGRQKNVRVVYSRPGERQGG